MKKVSLYVPCFNAEKTIASCLDAVFKQSYPLQEVVVVDDGSTDRTIDLALKYPVRVIRHANNLGLASARNSAIKSIKAEYVASLDSDCKPDKDWLSNLIEHFDSKKIGGCGGKLLERYQDDICDLWRSVHMRQYWGDKEKHPSFLFGSNCVFSTAALEKIGFYDDGLRNNYEDVDISNRLTKAGYSLIYEPQAVAYHLRKDNLRTVLNNFWNWNSVFYQKKGFYSGGNSFSLKIKDNIGLANRFLEEDIKSKKEKILYLDFLLAIHHSLKDFIFFTFKNKFNAANIYSCDKFSAWLSLFDLTFFYHLDEEKDNLRTLMPVNNMFSQNLFALNLVLSNSLRDKFKRDEFKKKVFRDIILSTSDIQDDELLDRLYNLSEFHQNWSGLITKKHANINSEFLSVLSGAFKNWGDRLSRRFPKVFFKMEESRQALI